MSLTIRLLFLSAALLGLASIGCRNSRPGGAQAPPPGPGVGPQSAAAPRQRLAAQSRVNKFGIREKVLIVERGVRCRASLPDGPLSVGALKFFWPYFVHNVSGEGMGAFYQVGDTPRKDSIRGWVSAAVAVPWPTRVGDDYDPSSGAPLLIYPTSEALVEKIKTGKTAVEPLARATPSTRRPWMPWPVAESRLVDHNGKTYEMVRLLFLGAYRHGDDLAQAERLGLGATRPAYTDAEVARFRAELGKLDVVFVVDNTASTTPFVPLIVRAIETMSKQLKASRSHPDVAFGIVLYRDYVNAILFREGPGPGSVVKVFPFQTDLDVFLRTVRPLRAATASSEDYPEAVADGVDAGLVRMIWRGGKLSNRVLVLIGDNSGHQPGHPKNPRNISIDQLVRTARGLGVRIFGLCVHGEGGPAERALHARQWKELAEGTGGRSYPLAESDKVVARIDEVLRTRVREVEARVRFVEEKRKGKANHEVSLDERERCAVVEFLKKANVDADRLGPNVATFATGWALTEVRGRAVLRRKVFIARPELDLLMSELNTLNSVLGSPKGVGKALELAAGSRIDPSSFFARRADEAPHETMDVFLMKQDIPCPQGLLRLTRAEIEHMSEERRAFLRDRLSKTVLPGLLNARNDDRVFVWLNGLELGWVDESLFP